MLTACKTFLHRHAALRAVCCLLLLAALLLYWLFAGRDEIPFVYNAF